MLSARGSVRPIPVLRTIAKSVDAGRLDSSPTLIGKGIPEVAGTQKAHGEGGAKFIDAAKKALKLEGEYWSSQDMSGFFGKLADGLGNCGHGLLYRPHKAVSKGHHIY